MFVNELFEASAGMTVGEGLLLTGLGSVYCLKVSVRVIVKDEQAMGAPHSVGSTHTQNGQWEYVPWRGGISFLCY